MTFGQFIKDLRRQAGYTQQNIADLLGIDRSTYSYYETDRTKPGLQLVMQLSKLYNMSVDDLTSCRMPRGNIVFCSPEPYTGFDTSDIQFFRSLNRREKSIILMYRSCSDQEGLMRCIREFTDRLVDEEMKLMQKEEEE